MLFTLELLLGRGCVPTGGVSRAVGRQWQT
jgi:hypothetical protein